MAATCISLCHARTHTRHMAAIWQRRPGCQKTRTRTRSPDVLQKTVECVCVYSCRVCFGSGGFKMFTNPRLPVLCLAEQAWTRAFLSPLPSPNQPLSFAHGNSYWESCLSERLYTEMTFEVLPVLCF